ncbi:uncharacterized protein BDR25DRAFT_98176 [Lindgomyces ingoldianus]|uniref:Uncharacterized protein n=1 Tax=Lindgomyces ingoldianus TaxID=673940 RepID=A0ACB6QBG3_9PLEO|nr:uncharacterized protein BDR25DRAFT_98176 [Lindgomyces ingoldianus]KAF2464314.1 hypothetical protein BDR25DRAFT_98176 [Lindgomyces ingoldianus]
MGTNRTINVVLMGAGASSLDFFKKAEEKMEDLDIVTRVQYLPYTISSLGRSNHGVITIPMHHRSGSISRVSSLKTTFSLRIRKFIKLRYKIKHVEWDNRAGLWRFRIRDLNKDRVIEDSAEFFISVGGVLNNWKWPQKPGPHSFKSKLMHSVHYDEGYNLARKRMAVIGAGVAVSRLWLHSRSKLVNCITGLGHQSGSRLDLRSHGQISTAQTCHIVEM